MPHLIGHDPRALTQLTRLMDTVFKGHPYIKSAIDMALNDLTARAAGVPLVTMLGGKDGDMADLYKVVTHGEPDSMAKNAAKYVADGYRRLQIKVGGEVRGDIDRVRAVAGAVPRGTVLSEAVLTIAGRRFGCAGVTQDGRLVGIVTDGDLRRHIGPKLLEMSVDELMTPSPLSVEPNLLASAALELMNRRRVTALFVVENGEPVGILHVHDLLRAGIV